MGNHSCMQSINISNGDLALLDTTITFEEYNQ